MKRVFASLFFIPIGLSLLLLPVQAQTTELEVFVSGAAVGSTANGMFFDNEGKLVVASAISNTISVVDVENGEILATYNHDQGVFTPDDVTVAADGTIYYTNILQGEIGAISPDGERSTVTMLPPGSNPITLSDEGRLFASLCFLGDDLYEVNLDGSEPRLIIEDLGGCGLNGMDFGPDNMLYGPLWFGGSIAKVDVDSGEMTVVAEGIDVPAAVKFNSQGNLFALNSLTGDVLEVNLDSGEMTTVTQLAPGLDNLAFNAEDRLFVSSFVDGSIVEVMSDGSTRTVLEGGIIAPGGLALLNDETLFVADFLALRAFSTESAEAVYLEPDIVGFSALGAVGTIEADEATGNVLITSWFTNAVRVWEPETNTLIEDYTDFAVPLNAIWFDGDLVVAELGTGQVVRASGADRSERTVLTDLVEVPAGLAGNNSDLYVSDWSTGTIWQLIEEGEPLSEPRAVVEGLANPEGMALTADGSALVVVATGTDNVLWIDIATGEITVLAENVGVGIPGPAGYPPTHVMSDVAIASDGTIYVSADMGNMIYTIKS